MIPNSITIFTDGSSRGNPGPGGFGAVVIAGENVTELGGREEHTTNNRMELTAVISALSFLSGYKLSAKNDKLVVHTDSSYVINGITKWVFGWQKNGWKTTLKKEVENRDLWERLVGVVREKKIEWNQVGGHIGVAGNVRCDEIATIFADGTEPKLYSGPLSKYPIKNILDISHDSGTAKKKSSSKAHSRAAAYSYVSKIGDKIETHKSWAECESRVKGQRAKFKKVTSKEEETALLEEWRQQS